MKMQIEVTPVVWLLSSGRIELETRIQYPVDYSATIPRRQERLLVSEREITDAAGAIIRAEHQASILVLVLTAARGIEVTLGNTIVHDCR